VTGAGGRSRWQEQVTGAGNLLLLSAPAPCVCLLSAPVPAYYRGSSPSTRRLFFTENTPGTLFAA
jgi:hypothetical protein